jgi:hypothetical protein
MNIIFGNAINTVSSAHTILELDTFKIMPSGQLVKTYCVISNIPLTEFSQLENNKHIHQQLIEQYRQQNWTYCQSAVHSLIGCWNGEMDTFYQHLADRIDEHVTNPLDENWDYTITRN